ncbi:UNVERIFIED_CONTAM: hypothetical protein GTU68_057664 [Idotea baltica]|nr:hypothetical protein [Idotea baltica]
MLTAILTLTALALVFGLLLGFAAIRFKVEGDPIVEQIDKLLPQTQCGQCSFAGCRPYAEAIAEGSVDINRCPPGGEATIHALANLLEVDVKPLDEECGQMHTVIASECTGCDLCLPPCPVDCIDMVEIPMTPNNWRWPEPGELDAEEAEKA